MRSPPSSNSDRRDRVNHALSRFVFPGHVVPRAEMAEAVLAALDHGDDYADYLPAKRIVRPDGQVEELRQALRVIQTEARQQGFDKVLHVATRTLEGEGA